MEFNALTKLFDILEEYPDLESQIINIAPPFKNLKNPVLRRTVGKLATLERVAQIGGLNTDDFVNTLRQRVGLPPLEEATKTKISFHTDEPDWIKKNPEVEIDGSEMLDRGEHPVGLINKLMKDFKNGQVILLTTNFEPLPLIDAMEKQNYKVHIKKADDSDTSYLTFITR